MAEEGEQTQRRIKYAGFVSVICGVLVVIVAVGMAFVSDSSAVLSLQTAAVVLGGTGLALDGVFQVRDPSPPESDRERVITLLKTMLFLGLVLAGFYGPALF